MEKISGYELNVIFDLNRKLTTEESDELCNKIMELLDTSEVVSMNLTPVFENKESNKDYEMIGEIEED